MKQTILLIVCMSFFWNLSAQNHFIGVKSGLNWTNIASENVYQNSKARNGVIGGITYEYFVNEDFSIGTELLYDQRGFVEDISMNLEPFFRLTQNLNYISLPMKVSFYQTTNSLFSFVKVGLVPAHLINAKFTVPTIDNENKISGQETINITNEVSSFDLAGFAEFGGGYKISKKLWLSTSLSYQYSFISITNPNFFPDEKIRHRGLNINLGIMWSLNKTYKK